MTVMPLVCRELQRAAPATCVAFEIRPFFPAGDRVAVAHLAACVGTAAGPAPRPAGLMAELQGRPGRRVACWIAWPRTPFATLPAGVPAACVTLVEADDRAGGTRWSIGWVLVHPAARRQGLARALVATALNHARTAGAAEVCTETSSRWPAAAFWQAVGFTSVRSEN